MKQLVKKASYSANDKNYEIEIYSDGANWEGRTMLNGKQVSPTIEVSRCTADDIFIYRAEWAADAL